MNTADVAYHATLTAHKTTQISGCQPIAGCTFPTNLSIDYRRSNEMIFYE
jgi:hypothetical protein